MVEEDSALARRIVRFALATLGAQINDIGSEGQPSVCVVALRAAQLVAHVVSAEKLEVIEPAIWASYAGVDLDHFRSLAADSDITSVGHGRSGVTLAIYDIGRNGAA